MKVLEKVRHVADVGAAESVNGLIVITNRENRIQRRTVWTELLTGQDFEPAVLQNVGILKLLLLTFPLVSLVKPETQIGRILR